MNSLSKILGATFLLVTPITFAQEATIPLSQSYVHIAYGQECNETMKRTSFEEDHWYWMSPHPRVLDLSNSCVVAVERDNNPKLTFTLDFCRATITYWEGAIQRDCMKNPSSCLAYLEKLGRMISAWKYSDFGDVEVETEEDILKSIACTGQLMQAFTDFLASL